MTADVGNFNLFQREQQQIVQSDWEDIAALPGAAALFSVLTKSPIDNGLSFKTILPQGNITVYNDRWAWITAPNGMWIQWYTQSTSAQQNQADEDFRTRASTFSLLNQTLFPIY